MGGLGHQEYAIFCGAGISINSGLPSAKDLIENVLMELKISKADRGVIRSTLPFEALLGLLSDNVDIKEILEIFREGKPNTNHKLIAKMAKHGYIKYIFTTNFDTLIEDAFTDEGLSEGDSYIRLISEEDFSRFPEKGDQIVLCKLHGSIDDLDSIRTTIESISRRTLVDKRKAVVKQLFSGGTHEKVLVIGYSCSDFFDICPLIKSVNANKKEITLIRHTNDQDRYEKLELKKIDDDHPFKDYPGFEIIVNTDRFIKELWVNNEDAFDKYDPTNKTDWSGNINVWGKYLDGISGVRPFINGRIFHEISDYKKAIDYHEKALVQAQNCNNRYHMAVCYLELGNDHRFLGDYTKSMVCYTTAYDYYEQSNNPGGKLACNDNLAIIYRKQKQYDKAINIHKKTIKLSRALSKNNMDVNLSAKYGNLGNVYSEIGDYARALKYHRIALRESRRSGNKYGEMCNYGNISSVYYSLGDMEKSLYYGKKALDISIKMGSKLDEMISYDRIANIFYKQKKFDKAIRSHWMVMEICKQIDTGPEELRCLINFGHTLISCARSCYENAYNITLESHKKAVLNDFTSLVRSLDEEIERLEEKHKNVLL